MASALPNFEKFVVHAEEHTAGTRWKKYLSRFELLVTAMNLDTQAKHKKALLLHFAGEEVYDIYDTFSDEQKGGDNEEGYQKCVKSLTDHLNQRRILSMKLLSSDKQGRKRMKLLTHFVPD